MCVRVCVCVGGWVCGVHGEYTHTKNSYNSLRYNHQWVLALSTIVNTPTRYIVLVMMSSTTSNDVIPLAIFRTIYSIFM